MAEALPYTVRGRRGLGARFGGQLIGQVIVAASGEVADKRVSSVHTTFARTGRPDEPVTFGVLSTGVLSHTLSFHQEFPAGEWQLFVLRSTFAGGGRAFGTGQVFSADGHLVASCAQEAMIRRMAAPGQQLLVPHGSSRHGLNEGGQPRETADTRRVKKPV